MTLPVFIEYAMNIFVGNIDQIMISGYSQNAVAAITNANNVLNLLLLTFTVISLATTILVSQYIGAEKRDEVGTVYTLAVVLNTAVGVAISIGLALLAHPIAVIMRVDPSLYTDFEAYMRIVGGFIFLQAIFTAFSAIFKSNAFMKEATFLSIGVNIVNVLFNWLLIYGVGIFPEMGIKGVATATVIGRLFGAAAMVYLYYRKIGTSLSLKQLKPFPTSIFRKMMVIGVPSAGESISYNLTQVVIMVMINGFGIASVNTKAYAGMFAGITWMFASAVSQASQILIGYDIGAGDIKSAQKQVKTTLVLAASVSFAVAVALFLAEGPIFSIVTKDPEVIELGKRVLMIDIILEIGRAVNMTMVRSLQAAGDTRYPVFIGIISTWTISVLFAYIFGVVLGYGICGVWAAMACDEIVRGIIFIFRWKNGKWKNKSFVS